MSKAARLLGRLSFAVAIGAPLAAGAQAALTDSVLAGPQPVQRVAGKVMRGTPGGLRPMPGLRVTLHRVGPDKSGPLDSARTAPDGSYGFRYRPSGSADAVYFVSASYGGIAYFSEPTRTGAVGDAGAITVFDTTSAPVRIRLAGRHVVVSAPGEDGSREIAEVFDLSNDTSVTLVSRGGTQPVWVTHLPPGANGVHANPAADIAPGAITFRGDSVLLFAPLSPGIRQLSFVYALPKSAFPLTLPLDRAASVLEMLVEEPKMKVTGAALKEVAPVAADGRAFRRFLGEDVPAGVVLTLDPPAPEFARNRYIVVLAVLFGLAMTVSLVVAFRRRARARSPRRATSAAALATASAAVPAHDGSQALVREIAALDARAERASLGDDERARYLAERDALKSRLAALLAAERGAD